MRAWRSLSTALGHGDAARAAAAACNGAAGLTPEASQALIVSLHNSYRKTMASEARLGQAEMELEEARQAAERAQEVAEREALATPRLEKRVSRLTYELNEARVRIAELTSARRKMMQPFRSARVTSQSLGGARNCAGNCTNPNAQNGSRSSFDTDQG